VHDRDLPRNLMPAAAHRMTTVLVKGNHELTEIAASGDHIHHVTGIWPAGSAPPRRTSGSVDRRRAVPMVGAVLNPAIAARS